MGVSKVKLNGKTLVDLTGDTVDRHNLPQGVTAHNAAGEKVTGEFSIDDMMPGFTEAGKRENIKSGEKVSMILGKIAKWFSDLKPAAFLALTNNLLANVAGTALDAVQGAVLKGLWDQHETKINKINSDLDAYRIKSYYDVSQLEITSWFIPDIINALPYNSRFVCDVASGIRDDSRNKLPLSLGTITIECATTARFRVMFNYSAAASVGQLYIASVDTVNRIVNKWYQVNVTAV